MPNETTLTQAVCRAVLEELRRRAPLIDSSPDLVQLTITVRLQHDPADPVKSVSFEDRNERRRGQRGYDGRQEFAGRE